MSYGPHGPYEFGWPDELVDIHFPAGGGASNASSPWYYYLTPQTPTYFQYLGSQVGGRGWQCEEFLPIIKILPVDTRPLVPTTPVGFGSVEEAITRTNNGEPISQDAWGRINFKNAFFWKVMGLKPPTWADFSNGLPKSRVGDGHRAVNLYIGEAIESWRDKWQREALVFNASTAGVDGSGSYSQYGAGLFALPVPGAGRSTINLGSYAPDSYYFGPVPPFVTFERGQALIFKQSFAFRYEIAQLDPHRWDMNVFPPRDTTLGPFEKGSTTKPPSAISGKYNGYGSVNFPLTSPIIAG